MTQKQKSILHAFLKIPPRHSVPLEPSFFPMIPPRNRTPPLIPRQYELQPPQVNLQILLATPLTDFHLRHQLQKLQLPFPRQRPQDPFRGFVRQTSVVGEQVDQIQETGAFGGGVGLESAQFFIEAVDVVDDDAEFGVGFFDVGDGSEG